MIELPGNVIIRYGISALREAEKFYFTLLWDSGNLKRINSLVKKKQDKGNRSIPDHR